MKHKLYPRLFEKTHIGNVELKNRIVRAPMGSSLSNPDGSASQRLIQAYAEAADGGAGLVFMDCALPVAGHHIGTNAHSDNYIGSLSVLAEAISYHGAVPGLQIAHPGRDAAFVRGDDLICASAVMWEMWYKFGAPIPREVTIDEIHELVEAWGDAALRAKIAGFKIVDIHGACGTLVSNFLSPMYNRRTDMYGGDIYNRARFGCEIIQNIKQKCGPDFPVLMRMSGCDHEPGGIVIEDSVEAAKLFEQAGADAIDVTGGSHAEVTYAGSIHLPWGINLEDAAKIKAAVNVPVLCAGGIKTPEFAEKALEDDKCDFVALGKPSLADPFWAKKAKNCQSEDIRPCIGCMIGCHDRGIVSGQVIHCAVNPALYKFERPAIEQAAQPRKVAVIGGGPAGCVAAITAKREGHDVTIYEKRELGGVMLEAAVPSYKADIHNLIKYYQTQIDKLDIPIVKEEATVETIKNGGYEAVIVAVGAKVNKLDVPGIDSDNVSYALDVINGDVETGNKVVVIGGGITGAETAEQLAVQGKDVTVVEMLDQFLGNAGVSTGAYMGKIMMAGVKIICGHRLESVGEGTVTVADRFGKRLVLDADSVVISAGFLPQKELAAQLEEELDIEVLTAGDCNRARQIMDAVHEGYIAAKQLTY